MWRVARRSGAELTGDDLAWHEEPAAPPAEGELLVRVQHAVLDPTLWAALPPPAVGEVVPSAGLGVVVESRAPGIAPGTKVSGLFGWRTFARIPAAQAFVHDPAEGFSDEDYLGALNHLGATAYVGVREVAKPAAGETFVVVGAAGAVGSLAGQLAKQEGARVVGIAATAEQCAWLTGELGFDAAINRAAEDLGPALAKACPEGVHAVLACLDSSGGPQLDACLPHLARGARVAVFAGSPAVRALPGPAHFPAIAVRRARVQGFSFLDYPLQFQEALSALSALRRAGKLSYRLDVTEGLEHAVAGLRRLKSDGDTLVFRLRA